MPGMMAVWSTEKLGIKSMYVSSLQRHAPPFTILIVLAFMDRGTREKVPRLLARKRSDPTITYADIRFETRRSRRQYTTNAIRSGAVRKPLEVSAQHFIGPLIRRPSPGLGWAVGGRGESPQRQGIANLEVGGLMSRLNAVGSTVAPDRKRRTFAGAPGKCMVVFCRPPTVGSFVPLKMSGFSVARRP